MMYRVGDIVDSRFRVTGSCSESGGMGGVVFVEDMSGELPDGIVLKYCKDLSEENLRRFSREVRLLGNFHGNSRVVKVFYSNVAGSPPYFVMPFYSQGDLSILSPRLQQDASFQEIIFNSMIECIHELHVVGVYHRDIKPQNFLLSDNGLVVSDLGLGVESDSSSRFTGSIGYWGTQGYLPPEFSSNGGFQQHSAAGDIFMLGKSFYALLTGHNPAYLMDGADIHPALYHVIRKSCELDKNRRYQTLSELKQALSMAYDVILTRRGREGEIEHLFGAINDSLKSSGTYSKEQVSAFMQSLSLVSDDKKIEVFMEMDRSFIILFLDNELLPFLKDFLTYYGLMARSGRYSWSFAEAIASDMNKIFSVNFVPYDMRAEALSIAIYAAYIMNRFAAMDTCQAMISSVTDEELGAHVVSVIQASPYDFVRRLEPSRCRCSSIKIALESLKEREG